MNLEEEKKSYFQRNVQNRSSKKEKFKANTFALKKKEKLFSLKNIFTQVTDFNIIKIEFNKKIKQVIFLITTFFIQ